MEAGLDQAILEAHAQGDHCQLVSLYSKVADDFAATEKVDEACHLSTIAYVFALEEGMDEAGDLRRKLTLHDLEEQIISTP